MSSSASVKSDQDQAPSLITNLTNVITEQVNIYSFKWSNYALLDFPNHSNVGDSAIWLGELAHLEAVLGSPPAFVCVHNYFDADALRRAVPSGPIFLHGGGNFGDLWPEHHMFRESIIEQFADRRIIQLPQTIHFSNPDLIERTAAIIKRHGNFVLFVRDKHSFEIASSSFDCPVHLAPDTAFSLGTIHRPVTATLKLLMLVRTDKESALQEAALRRDLPEGVVIADWLEEDPDLFNEMKRLTAVLNPLKLGFNAQLKYRELLFRSLAQNRVYRGVKLLSSAEYVITDRLHCHILCMLLGVPHIVFDNNYGKLSSFIEAWTKDCVRVAPSLDKAIELWSSSRGSIPSGNM